MILPKTVSCLEYWIKTLNDETAKEKIKYLEINQEGDLILVRYGKFSSAGDGQYEITVEDLWNADNGFFLECRSVVINLKTEEIVIAPFKKFRNLNECPENDIKVVTEEIKNAKTVETQINLMEVCSVYVGITAKSSCLAVRRLTLICRGD